MEDSKNAVGTPVYFYRGPRNIWCGDEVGMWGADDPDTRKPMVWNDLKYDDEKTHPFLNRDHCG